MLKGAILSNTNYYLFIIISSQVKGYLYYGDSSLGPNSVLSTFRTILSDIAVFAISVLFAFVLFGKVY